MNLQQQSFLLSLFCFPLNHQPRDGPQCVFSSRLPPSSFLVPLFLFFISLHETWAVCVMGCPSSQHFQILPLPAVTQGLTAGWWGISCYPGKQSLAGHSHGAGLLPPPC